MQPPVDITFDCLPLRSIGRMDVPMDASPAFRALAGRVKGAAEKHGFHNSYYLYNAACIYHLTNDPKTGMLEFRFEGTVLTGPDDQKTLRSDLQVELHRETCDWLTTPIVKWFRDTVETAVKVEFDRYIAAGDLKQTVQRLKRLEDESDSHEGFVGMGL
ncbi:MAG: hypothetical protein ACYTG0_04820 [Planctomycetota bacterium]|jgi:hypothetical protein